MNTGDDKPRRGLVGGCGKHLDDLLGVHRQLASTHADVKTVMGDLSRVVERLTPRIIGVQTVALDSNGTATAQYRLPFEALSVDSLSAHPLMVVAAPLGAAAPATGPGTHIVRPGGFAVMNLRAYQWSIYGGDPGELVSVTAYGTPQPPDSQGAKPSSPQTAVTANVAAATANTVLFAAAAQINGRTVFNDSTAVCYLKFGAAASTTSYTVQIAAGGYYEFPQPAYSGEVDAVWSAANGNARVTSW